MLVDDSEEGGEAVELVLEAALDPLLLTGLVHFAVGLARGPPTGDPVFDAGADALLLDSPVPGSGNVFDWALAEGVPVGRRMILAGGLTPDNVAAAVAEVQPWGVDTSTGVQADGDPTRKDPLKVQRFVRSARAAAPRPYHPEGNGPFDWADAGL